MSNPEDAVVYVIEHTNGFYKLGSSIKPEQRLRDIQVATPYELSLRTTVETVDDGRTSAEKALQGYYSCLHKRGEWYELPDAEVRALEILDGVRESDIVTASIQLRASPCRENGKTLIDNLREVWVLDYNPTEGDE